MLPISAIHEVFPPLHLADLRNSLAQDIENDIDCLLHWLEPLYPDGNAGFTEPSPRIKAAARSCLKDEQSQLDFIRLYINSIRIACDNLFRPMVAHSDLATVMNVIDSISTYYRQHLIHLGLSELARNLFWRNLNLLFHWHLIKQPLPFMHLLGQYLDTSLFAKPGSNATKNLPELQKYGKILVSIGLTDELNSTIIQLSIRRIRAYVLSLCTGVWDRPFLSQINDWIRSDLYPSFSLVLQLSTAELDDIYLHNLIKICHDELVLLRITEIFQLIVNFPNSKIALSELHVCILFRLNHDFNNTASNISRNNTLNSMNTSSMDLSLFKVVANIAETASNSQAYQRAKLVDTFIHACNENLLHSGANTVDVITTYTSTIKSFLIIDPKGVLLDKVVRPIRRYLKTREDIILKLVHGLLNEDPKTNELIELSIELRKGTSERPSHFLADDMIDNNWVPDPIDALPDFKKGKVTDVIESLISIFDLKEIFIDEFTKLFGDRLINLHNYDLLEVQNHLELLKARFGKDEFGTLDIMIRDVEESEKTNLKLHHRPVQGSDQPLLFHSTILSHLYWLSLLDNIETETAFKLPQQLQLQFENFKNNYSEIKKGRSLTLIPSLGVVKLDIDVNNTSFHFEVTPEQATVISLFDKNSEGLSVEFIADQLNLPGYNVSKVLEFWVRNGILVETTKDYFKPNEYDNVEMLTARKIESTVTGPDNSKGISDISTVIWPYVKNILDNMGLLPLARIHLMLGLSVPRQRLEISNISVTTLEEILDAMANEGQLDVKGNMYALK